MEFIYSFIGSLPNIPSCKVCACTLQCYNMHTGKKQTTTKTGGGGGVNMTAMEKLPGAFHIWKLCCSMQASRIMASGSTLCQIQMTPDYFILSIETSTCPIMYIIISSTPCTSECAKFQVLIAVPWLQCIRGSFLGFLHLKRDPFRPAVIESLACG